MKKHRAIIIGAGNIGAFFDDPESKHILTHAHAYSIHPDFELVGFVDVDTERAKKAAEIWGGVAYPDINSVFSAEKEIDVVSVCTPDQFHSEVIKNLLEKPIKLIFAEKPLTQSVAEAEEAVRIAKTKNISILVNYSRRFLPEFQEIASSIKSRKYGNFLVGNGYYNKGVLHNGSHLIDLVRFLVGEVSDSKTIALDNDFYADDPSCSAVLNLNNGKNLTILSAPATFFTIFELDLVFEKGRIEIRDSGNQIEISKIAESDVFKNYKYLVSDRKISSSLDKAIYFAVDNISNHINSNVKLICDGGEAILDLETAINIKEKAVL